MTKNLMITITLDKVREVLKADLTAKGTPNGANLSLFIKPVLT